MSWGGWPAYDDHANARTFHLNKTFTCDYGTGTLSISLDAATANGSPQDQGGWTVIGATGEYGDTVGGGNLVGDYYPGGILDHYTGYLR